MTNNSINWMGNRVLDPNISSPAAQPAAASIPSRSNSFSSPAVPAQLDNVMLPSTQQGPPPSTAPGYIPYYLASNIGKNVRAEFIIGSNQYADKTGKLIEVGINYFVLEDVNSRTHIMCDLYSVKFVTILQS